MRRTEGGKGVKGRRSRRDGSTGKDRGTRTRGRAEGGTKDYSENISLLEKFSTPLSASIVIYARDEGGYGALYRRF